MYISVKNGTNAGWNRRAKAQVKTDWSCCGQALRYFLTRCPKCGGHNGNS